MNYQFFESLSGTDAELYLERFLTAGRPARGPLTQDAFRCGIDADLSVSGLVPMFAWLTGLASAVPLEPDPTVPEWIRATPEYARNLFDLDQDSKVLALRGAFYLGEAFRVSHSGLSWAVGRAETVPQGQPVVTAFKFSMEMPVLLVSETLFSGCSPARRRVLSYPLWSRLGKRRSYRLGSADWTDARGSAHR
jgi:hypothetical protein